MQVCHTVAAGADAIYAVYYGACYYSSKETKDDMCLHGAGCWTQQDKITWGQGSCPADTMAIDWDSQQKAPCGKHCAAETMPVVSVQDPDPTCVWCERIARVLSIPAKLPFGNSTIEAGIGALRKKCGYPNATAAAQLPASELVDEAPFPMFPIPPNGVCAIFLDSMAKIIAWLSEGVTPEQLCHEKLDMCPSSTTEMVV